MNGARLVCFLLLVVVSMSSVKYVLDDQWHPAFPDGAHTFSAVAVPPPTSPGQELLFVTQRGNSSLSPVLVMNTSTGALLYQWGKKSVGLDPTTKTWGAHGIAVERCSFDCSTDTTFPDLRVVIDDFSSHTLTAYTASQGDMLWQLGTSGTAGNGTLPLQFGSVADTVVQSTPDSNKSSLFVSDGDGGTANRVLKLTYDVQHPTFPPQPQWITPAMFNNPHGIAYHARTGLVIVADRDNDNIALLEANTGQSMGTLDCGLNLGTQGKPFSVRTWLSQDASLDLLYVAIMDNPQDQKNQRIAVVDISGITTTSSKVTGTCKEVQDIVIPPAQYSGPHLLAVNEANGNVYAALVSDTPLSTVLRYTLSQ